MAVYKRLGAPLFEISRVVFIVPVRIADVETCHCEYDALCNGNIIIDHDGSRPGLPNRPVVMEHDNDRSEI